MKSGRRSGEFSGLFGGFGFWVRCDRGDEVMAAGDRLGPIPYGWIGDDEAVTWAGDEGDGACFGSLHIFLSGRGVIHRGG
jgi:hypothetical protein